MRVLRDIAGIIASFTLLLLTFGFVGGGWPYGGDYADQQIMEAMEKEMRVKRVLSMPPADPIYERPMDLLRMTRPVPCVRFEGEHRGMGGEWIRQWSDGALPPLMPTCVRASSDDAVTKGAL